MSMQQHHRQQSFSNAILRRLSSNFRYEKTPSAISDGSFKKKFDVPPSVAEEITFDDKTTKLMKPETVPPPPRSSPIKFSRVPSPNREGLSSPSTTPIGRKPNDASKLAPPSELHRAHFGSTPRLRMETVPSFSKISSTRPFMMKTAMCTNVLPTALTCPTVASCVQVQSTDGTSASVGTIRVNKAVHPKTVLQAPAVPTDVKRLCCPSFGTERVSTDIFGMFRPPKVTYRKLKMLDPPLHDAVQGLVVCELELYKLLSTDRPESTFAISKLHSATSRTRPRSQLSRGLAYRTAASVYQPLEETSPSNIAFSTATASEATEQDLEVIMTKFVVQTFLCDKETMTEKVRSKDIRVITEDNNDTNKNAYRQESFLDNRVRREEEDKSKDTKEVVEERDKLELRVIEEEQKSTEDEGNESEWEYYSDEGTADEAPKKSVANLYSCGIPASLLTRWDRIWDSSSEEEEDYSSDDSVDLSSPYCCMATETNYVDDEENIEEVREKLKEWVEKMVDPQGKIVEELNASFHMLMPLCQGSKKKLKKGAKKPAEGIVKETVQDKEGHITSQTETSYCAGERHGFYRDLSPTGKEVRSLGRFVRGERRGVQWKRVQGNAFFVGYVDENNNCIYSTTYLYPDLVSAIQGDFENGKMKSGRYGRVTSIDFEYGIPVPRVTELSDTTYCHDTATTIHMSKFPMLRDPYEHEQVYVAPSRIPFAGEGLYAKRPIRPKSLVALFNGVRERDSVNYAFIGELVKQRAFSDYRISLSREMCLDIPVGQEMLTKYRATLGHKCCHSFTPNSVFEQLYHPRFGSIMSIVSIKDIKAHEEVTVSYNYDLMHAPEWYRNVYFKHLREVERMEEEAIYALARKKSRLFGAALVVPPPDPASDRFIPCVRCDGHVGFDLPAISCARCNRWFHAGCTGTQDIVSRSQASSETNWTCEREDCRAKAKQG